MNSAAAQAVRAAVVSMALAAVAACGGGGGGGNEPPPPVALTIASTTLASGVLGVPYNQTVRVSGGTGARTFSVTDGSLPEGLSLNATNGVIAGTPAGVAGTADFTVAVEDSGSPAQTDSQVLSITINATALGRNDTIATATALGNGTFSASISPSGDPASILDPDEDYYQITTTAASTVTIDIDAQVNGSPLDSVIEIVDETGVRLNTCVAPAFTTACVHDDEVPTVDLDSYLQLRVIGATTFYIHVVDWASDARPDKLYELVITGVN